MSVNLINLYRRRATFFALTTLAAGLVAVALLWSLSTSNEVGAAFDPVRERQLKEASSLLKQKDYPAAAKALQMLADSGDAKAKFLYGRLLARGWGVERDLHTARDYLLQAVSTEFNNRAQAAFELGKLYRISRGKNCHELAFEWFKKALQWGERKAHPKLAEAYAKALGTDFDFELAKKHYQADALAGSADSAVKLIELVEKGLPTQAGNRDEAILLLLEFLPVMQQAGHFGNPKAARSLARLYLKDSLGHRNLEKAVYWLTEATRLGDAIAMHDLALLADTEEGPVFNSIQVVDLLQESSRRNYPAAFTALGRLHLKEKYSLPLAGAAAWFDRGVKAGHPGAMEELSKLHFHGHIVGKNHKKAKALAEQGAKLRHKGSIKFLKEIEAHQTATQSDSNKGYGNGF